MINSSLLYFLTLCVLLITREMKKSLIIFALHKTQIRQYEVTILIQPSSLPELVTAQIWGEKCVVCVYVSVCVCLVGVLLIVISQRSDVNASS